MKIKASKIAFFYLRLFFRIVTFQRVTADSSKKFLAAGLSASAASRSFHHVSLAYRHPLSQRLVLR
jgi:hypothetical protein